MSEPPGHGDRVGSEVSRCQGSDEGGPVWTAHQEVAGENLLEALVEIGLNESDEGGRHVLLDRCLCSEAEFYLVHCFQECCELEHRWVTLLQS